MVIMTLADLIRETIDIPEQEVWENERTLTPVRVFGVRLHSIGLSLWEVIAVFDVLGIDRSHRDVWNWTHDLAETRSDPPTMLRYSRGDFHFNHPTSYPASFLFLRLLRLS